MSERNGSSTALGTLYLRAAHQLLDAPPFILDDHVALKLLGDAAVQQIKNAEQQHRTTQARVLRSHVLLRSRFAEDRLAASIQRGITQYVILGAGFDTFAYRQPVWAQALKIFEVDQSATQSMKRSQLIKAGITVPTNTHFVSIDFEHETLLDGLLMHGVSLADPTFFSWLGVTMYLKEEAVDAVLRSVAKFPAGSEIVFTFTLPPESLTAEEGGLHSTLADLVARVGEPFVSYFTPGAIEAKLHDAGFNAIGFLSPEEAAERYFRGLPLNYVPKRSAIVYAVV